MKEFMQAFITTGLVVVIGICAVLGIAAAVSNKQDQILQKEYEASYKKYEVFTCVKEYTTDEQYSKRSSYTRYFACFQSETGEYKTFEIVNVRISKKKPADMFAGIFVGKVYDVQLLNSSLYEYPIILDIREHK